MREILKLGVLAGVTALAAVSASANSITVTETGAVNTTGGSDWSYDLSFVNSTLNKGDFVTINDFGPATGVTVPAGWAMTQAPTGPNSLPATDSPSKLNVTLTWTGANGTVMSPDPTTTTVATLTLHSPTSVAVGGTADYTTIDQVTSGLVAGTDSRVIGSTIVPPRPPTVPDGGMTLALLGFASPGIEGLRRKLSK